MVAFLIFSSHREHKESNPPWQAGMKAETERQGTVGVTSASSAVVDYFVYPASVLLTNS